MGRCGKRFQFVYHRMGTGREGGKPLDWRTRTRAYVFLVGWDGTGLGNGLGNRSGTKIGKSVGNAVGNAVGKRSGILGEWSRMLGSA